MAKSSFATGFAGFLIGVVTGLAIAAGAALFIVNSPIPFVDNKVDKVTADVDPAQKLQGGVDPNARLNEAESLQAPEIGSVKTVQAPDEAARDARGKAVEPGRVQPKTYWVQVAAFSNKDEAETHAASLAMQGIGAQVSRAGTAWRVRIGPFDDRASATEVAEHLPDQGSKPMIVEQRQ